MTNKNNDHNNNNDEQELKPMNQEQESDQQKHDIIIKPSSSKNSNNKRTVIEYRHSASPLTSLLIITLMITSIYIITTKSEASHPHGESYKIEDENNLTTTTTTASPFSSPTTLISTPHQTESRSNTNGRGGKDVDNTNTNTQNYQQSPSPKKKKKRSQFLQTTCNQSVRSGAIFLFNLRPKLLSRPRSRMKTCQQTDVTSQTSCADQWLQQCWFLSTTKSKSSASSSSDVNNDDVWTGQKLTDLYSTNNELKQIATCDPMTMKKFITSVIRMPRKAWVWRENATTFVGEAKIILQHDEMVLKMTCDEIERMSRYICLNFPFRPLEGEFSRRSSNQKLDQFQIKDHLGLEYNFNVLEGIEFRTQQQEQLDKNDENKRNSASARRKRQPKKTEVDLICSGMFQQNLVAAKALWSFAESTYFSKFDFRYRHFFQWNTVRDSRIRLVKAKRLYGQDLTKRTEMIRSGVIGDEYQTWMTLDIDSPPADIKEQLMELFHQVTVLRFVAAKYLFTMDQLWKRGQQDALSTSSSSSSFKLADFIVWVRPDLAYHSAHLAQVIRHPKSFGDAIELRARVSSRGSRKLKQRNFVIRADLADEEVQTKKMYPEAPPLDPNRTNTIYVQDPFGSSGHLKVTDLFMFGNASGLIHLYSFLPSLLHSCIYHPTPIQFFVEYFLKIAANDYYHMHVQMIQFGAFIDRTGNENQTLPPTTEMP